MFEFRVVGPRDAQALAAMFLDVDATLFHPHDFSSDEARRIASHAGHDVYALLYEKGAPVAYGMLRGFDEGYLIPSLGIAVRADAWGRGIGRLMIGHLHAEAARRGATVIRLRVRPENVRARRLYESLGYAYAGNDRDELVMVIDLQMGTESPPGGEREPATLTGRLLDIDAPEWLAALRSTRHDFYHLPAYVALSAAHERGEPRALYVTEGEKAMLLPLVIRNIPGGGIDATSPNGYPGPVGIGTEDPAFLRIALAAGVQVLREASVVSAFIRLHPLLNPIPPTGIGTTVRHGATVGIDLTLTTEELWAQTRSGHRSDITRTMRLGYVAQMDVHWRHFDSFKQMYRETMARVSAAPFFFFDDAYFDSLRYGLGDRVHLCVVEKDGVPAAAALFVETDGIVQYHLSGSDEAFRSVQPTKLMIHFARGWAKDRGNELLHLGGGVGGDSDSLLAFKAGFAPPRHAFSTLRIVVDEAGYRRHLKSHDPLLDASARTGYFPLYRRSAP